MDSEEIHRKAIESARQGFIDSTLRSMDYLELVARLEEVVEDLKEKLIIESIRGHTLRPFLVQSGINPSAIEERLKSERKPLLPLKVSVNDILRDVAPGLSSKKKLTGDSLLDVLAREIVVTGKTLNYSQMIQVLDDKRIERPGANYRNNLISLIVKSPHKFQRVGRGTYTVTPTEMERQRAKLEKEGLPL